jgi:DNA-binding CsgD family transcriptional regulator
MASDHDQLANQLDVIIRLLALLASRDEESLREKSAVLARAGMTPSAIAQTLGTTANTVSVELSKRRKKLTGKRRE